MSEWQPIETAPKLKKVLVSYVNRHGKRRTVVGKYFPKYTLENDPDEFCYVDDGEQFAEEGWYENTQTHAHIYLTECPPTHWMPLPEAPK